MTLIRINSILALVGAFSALDTNSGGVTDTTYNSVGVSGCNGKMVVTPTFKRGHIE